MIPPVIADTGGLLSALARTPHGKPSFPDYEAVLRSAAAVIVPGLVLAEVDYFLRANRTVTRKLVAEIFDPATCYEYELPLASDIARALELDARFADLGPGLVDGTVAAVAERRQIYRVLTVDRRDFGAIRVGPRLAPARWSSYLSRPILLCFSLNGRAIVHELRKNSPLNPVARPPLAIMKACPLL